MHTVIISMVSQRVTHMRVCVSLSLSGDDERQTCTAFVCCVCKGRCKVCVCDPGIAMSLPMMQDPGAMVSQMSEDERQELLRHLKRKWASVNGAYQKQPLSTDSEQKKHRKEEIERLLAEIEKDIKTLERGDMILIMVRVLVSVSVYVCLL